MSFIPPRSHVAGLERLERRARASRADALDRMRSRTEDPSDQPTEALVCPSCRATFDEGSVCFACDAPLIGASLVDAWEPSPPDRLGRTVFTIAGVLFAAVVVATLVF